MNKNSVERSFNDIFLIKSLLEKSWFSNSILWEKNNKNNSLISSLEITINNNKISVTIKILYNHKSHIIVNKNTKLKKPNHNEIRKLNIELSLLPENKSKYFNIFCQNETHKNIIRIGNIKYQIILKNNVNHEIYVKSFQPEIWKNIKHKINKFNKKYHINSEKPKLTFFQLLLYFINL